MDKKINMDITIDSSYLLTFAHIQMEMFKVFREFIDNSLQSYLDHREELKNVGGISSCCIVSITWDEAEMIVKDNAWGMNEDAFSRVLKLNKLAPGADKPDRLSRFGVGFKAAAYHVSKDVIVESSEYGSEIKYKTEMDLDYISRVHPHPTSNTVAEIPCDKEMHGTTIILKRLYEGCSLPSKNSKEFKKTIDSLSRIYTKYIESKDLEIDINNVPVNAFKPQLQIDPERGSKCITYFSNEEGFLFGGKRYRYDGSIGVLEKGDSSGVKTGLAFYQAGRAIRLSDHPEALFGKKNDFRYQRVVGEINIHGNEWPITENKDDIMWGSAGLLENFLADIKKNPEVKRLLNIAKSIRIRPKKFDSVLKSLGSHESAKSKNIKSQGYVVSDRSTLTVPNVSSVLLPKNISIDSYEKKNTSEGNRKNDEELTVEEITKDDSELISGVYSDVDKWTLKVTKGDETYTFDASLLRSVEDEEWLKISDTKTTGKDHYAKLSINCSAKNMAENLTNNSSLKIMIIFAEAIAMSYIDSHCQGVSERDECIILNYINEAIRRMSKAKK